MSFLKNTTSFTRFRVVDTVLPEFWGKLPDLLRQYSLKDIDESVEERSVGWVSFDDMLDTSFTRSPIEKGEFVTFSLRLDTRRVPPAVINKHVKIALRKEEVLQQELGKKFIAKDRKKEIKEQVILRLRSRFLPIPAEFQVVWNTATAMLYFASTQGKMIDTFQDYFTRSFNLHLEQITPYGLALLALGDAALLDNIEPTRFA